MHNQSSITSSYCCEVIVVHNLSLTFPFIIYPMQFVISSFMEDLLEKKNPAGYIGNVKNVEAGFDKYCFLKCLLCGMLFIGVFHWLFWQYPRC